jgi:ABC-type transport system substrate-binding protein
MHGFPGFRALFLGTALGASLLLQPGPVQAASPPGTLTVAVEAPFGVDPHFLFVGPNMAASRQVYDSVINRDAESRFIPGLVQSWEATDATTWVLKLREGVQFQDGSPFTAEDIAFSIARVSAVPNNPGPYTSNLRTIAAVEVVDSHTVRITTDRPNPTLMGQLTNIFVVSRNAARGDGSRPPAPAPPISTAARPPSALAPSAWWRCMARKACRLSAIPPIGAPRRASRRSRSASSAAMPPVWPLCYPAMWT